MAECRVERFRVADVLRVVCVAYVSNPTRTIRWHRIKVPTTCCVPLNVSEYVHPSVSKCFWRSNHHAHHPPLFSLCTIAQSHTHLVCGVCVWLVLMSLRLRRLLVGSWPCRVLLRSRPAVVRLRRAGVARVCVASG